MTDEREFLQTQLNELKSARNSLPKKFAEAQTNTERHIHELCVQAGIANDIKKAKDDLDQFRDNLQRQADELTGRINAFEQIFDKYHRDMVEPGEYLYGIDLSKLDWRTRLLVRGGNRQTIAALGGTWAEETDMPLQDALQEEGL
jgi:hypothetical protein